MDTIVTEIVIPMGQQFSIFSETMIKLRIGDEGAGPYLVVSGINHEPYEADGETGNEFFLCSEKDINDFAKICKKMLVAAQRKCK